MTPKNLFKTKILKIIDYETNVEVFNCPTPMKKIKIIFENKELNKCNDSFIYLFIL